jgi:transposase-like protein
MKECPLCGSKDIKKDGHRTLRDGKTKVQRWECNACNKKFTFQNKDPSLTIEVMNLHAKEYSTRQIEAVLMEKFNIKRASGNISIDIKRYWYKIEDFIDKNIPDDAETVEMGYKELWQYLPKGSKKHIIKTIDEEYYMKKYWEKE